MGSYRYSEQEATADAAMSVPTRPPMSGASSETDDVDQLLSTNFGRISINELDAVNPEDSETLIAKELTQLSIQERNEVLHDLHCVSRSVEETSSFLKEHLDLLEYEISKIPKESKLAYEHAQSVFPAFVQDQAFRLMFLRAVRFEAPEAAGRIVNFFELKRQLFGPHKLATKICLSDLDEDTMACLSSGYIQLLSGRDRAGRAVIMGVAKLRLFRSELSLMRSFWYMAMTALEDEETQKQGIVFLSYAVGQPVLQRSGVFKLSNIFSVLPLRIVGIHVCVDDPKARLLATFATLLIESRHRVRFRCHCGTDLECQYKLMTFGISDKIVPISLTGELDETVHAAWLEKRQRMEDETERSTDLDRTTMLLVPGPYDVLFGRGKFIQEHVGNQRYRQIIASFRQRYDNALKVEKTCIAKDIVRIVEESGGRFLKQTEEGWIEASTDLARDKISHSFRNRRIVANQGWKEKMGRQVQNLPLASKSRQTFGFTLTEL